MASLTSAGDNIDWLWGSLKPWQILHSTLAERQRCGSVLDVWELVNQTLSASTLARRQEGDGGRSHTVLPMQFLGDIIDGDFWRHGGLMESKVKERLNALKHEEEEGIVARAHHQSVHRLNTELGTTIAASSVQRLVCTSGGSVAHKSTAPADLAVHQAYCRVCAAEHEGAGNEEKLLNAAAAVEEGAAEAEAEEEEEEEEEEAGEGEEGNHGYADEDEEEGEEEEDEDEVSNRAAYTHIIRADNYSLIRSSYEAKADFRSISTEGASVFVLSPSCSAAGGGAGDDQAASTWEETVKMGEAGLQLEAPPNVEENIEVCAVCLEKLTHYYEEGVQALACRHAFHTVCIAPWMQRQPHACCPCCRAPIFPANLEPPQLKYGAAPLDVAADSYQLHDRYACGGRQEGQGAAEEGSARHDIMGLLADMEAALEHLGFRS